MYKTKPNEILDFCGIPDGTNYVVATDKRYCLGDCLVHKDEPWHCIQIIVHEGPWMKGPSHIPGKDYRSATEAEWERFKTGGVHLREPKLAEYIASLEGE